MNRRTFAVFAAALLTSISVPAGAQSQGIKIRFVITRTHSRSDGVVEKASYENAVLLSPRERFEKDLESYRIALRAVPVGEGVRVEVALRDLGKKMAQSVTGEVVVKIGQGGGIDFPAQDTGLYMVGILVTQQVLPSIGAA